MNTMQQSQSEEALLSLKNISLSFGGVKALTDISFDILKGEIRAIIGPNGAGKTTTMRIIATLLAPSFGRVEVCGHDTWSEREEVCGKLGFMPVSSSPKNRSRSRSQQARRGGNWLSTRNLMRPQRRHGSSVGRYRRWRHGLRGRAK